MIYEVSERDGLLSMISDLYKSVYGVRPSYDQYKNMSLIELDREITILGEASSRAVEEEEKIQQESVVAFNKRVQDLIETGAKDRETAIRWIMLAEDAPDTEYLEYELGLPYGYLQ